MNTSRLFVLNVLLLCGLLLSAGFPLSAEAVGAPDYAGSQSCISCHQKEYNQWHSSGHPFKLRKIDGREPEWQAPLPPGWAWSDISYTIGGTHKKIRFIDQDGFIITTNKKGEKAPTQFNFEDGTWSNYHPGEKKPYNCGRCHTTGYSKEGFQEGRPGLIGTWVFPGIQCEECHGPAAEHVALNIKGKETKEGVKVDKSAELCGKCHNRGGLNGKIMASKGLIRHHEQYNELKGSRNKEKAKMECIECHNPHQSARHIVVDCASCHAEETESLEKTPMPHQTVVCIDCHMPLGTKSATKYDDYSGDIRTHVFAISVDPKAKLTYKDAKGKEWGTGYVTLEVACLHCHKSRSANWAAKYAKGFHKK